MKILVTGGAGFIGSHICRELLNRGDSVICVDNFNDYYDPAIKEGNVKEFLEKPEFKLYRVDIRDVEGLKKIFREEKIDKIVHLAARAGVRPSIEQPQLYADVNINGTINLLEMAKEFGVKKFVFASSSSVYGENKKIPFAESDELNNMISPYAVTKKTGEELCYLYYTLYGISTVCLRFFTVYGPSGRPDLAIYKFTKLIDEGLPIDMYGDGSAKRDYTFVLDVVAGILASLDKEFGYEIFNLGNSNTVELKKMISLIEEALGKKAAINQKPNQQGDVPITCADLSKSREMLGYEPKTKIEEGIKVFVEWYKSKFG